MSVLSVPTTGDSVASLIRTGRYALVFTPRRANHGQWRNTRRFHKTLLDEFYRGVFRKKIYRILEELQAEPDAWREDYNQHRPHQTAGVMARRRGRSLMDRVSLAKETILAP